MHSPWNLTIAAFLIGLASPEPVKSGSWSPKLVFAHYLVCCSIATPEPSIEQSVAEMKLAKSLGIDGFALNVGGWDREPEYSRNVSTFFIAAGRVPGFKLFLSVDNASHLTPREAAQALSLASTFQSQLVSTGHPVISTYDTSPDWLRAFRREAARLNLTPSVWANIQVDDGEIWVRGSNIEVPDSVRIRRLCLASTEQSGYFYFGAAGPTKSVVDVAEKFQSCLGSVNRAFVFPINALYRGAPENFRMFDGRGMTRLEAFWLAAIRSRAKIVELITWNDWGEGTYLRPTFMKASRMYRPSWPLVLEHSAYLQASQYFIEWFKTGRRPRIQSDRMYVFYQPQDVESRRLDRVSLRDGSTSVLPLIYVHFQLSRSRIIVVRSGGRTKILRIKPGVSNLAIKNAASETRIFAGSKTGYGFIAMLSRSRVFRDAKLDYATLSVELPW